MRAMGEYKPPQQETPESIVAYSQKNNFNYDYLYMAKNDSALAQVINHGYFSAGEIFPFDNQRHSIVISAQRNPKGCPHTTAVVYQSQDTSIATTLADTLDFWKRLSMMQLIDKRQGLSDITLATQNYDYFVMGSWIKMFPKMSATVHEDFRKAVAIDSTKKVCIISLNYDAKAGNRFFKAVEKQIKKGKKEIKKTEKAAKNREKKEL
jgi:phage anti-repressor protein